ncbi:MAG: hypothetical protein ACRDTD_06315, partial [Pseudonocardiaceae bacterium]
MRQGAAAQIVHLGKTLAEFPATSASAVVTAGRTSTAHAKVITKSSLALSRRSDNAHYVTSILGHAATLFSLTAVTVGFQG